MKLWRRFWLCLALILVSCTFYGTPVQIENWPDLRVVEHRVSAKEVGDACREYAPAGAAADSCAIFYAYQCHIWAQEGEIGEYLVPIERDNCAGLARPYWRSKMLEIRDRIWEMRNG